MAKFSFRLDPVLALRERVEREKQAAVAVIESERRVIEDQLRVVQAEIRTAKDYWRLALGGTVDPRGARQTAAASLHMQARAQRLVLQLAGTHKRLESARKHLVEAARARRAVELLRERRLQEWRREQSRREDAAVDEMAVMRAARTIVEGAVSC